MAQYNNFAFWNIQYTTSCVLDDTVKGKGSEEMGRVSCVADEPDDSRNTELPSKQDENLMN